MSRGSEVARFAVVGVGGVVGYLVVFALLRDALVAAGSQPAGAAQVANVTSRIALSLLTTWVNVRFTFRSRAGLVRCWVAGLGTLGIGAAASGVVLLMLHALVGRAA